LVTPGRVVHVEVNRRSSLPEYPLRGKQLISKPGRIRRYHVPADSARVIAALLALRDHVIAPILAGVRSPRTGRKPKIWTAIDRDYENLRVGMQTLFRHVGIDTLTAAA
jgi:hypothetical protein